MQKQFITIHTIYHDYVDGLSSHLSSKNDVKNLTILLLTLFGVLGLLLLRSKIHLILFIKQTITIKKKNYFLKLNSEKKLKFHQKENG